VGEPVGRLSRCVTCRLGASAQAKIAIRQGIEPQPARQQQSIFINWFRHYAGVQKSCTICAGGGNARGARVIANQAKVIAVSLASAGFLIFASWHPGASGEELEYDVCICKHVQTGSRSSLRSGVCQRTETDNCFMQWGAYGKQKAPIGNGLPQEEASRKAEQTIIQAVKGDFKITPLTSSPAGAPTLQLAMVILARVPPPDYEKYPVAESFVLAAGTALSRFDVPLGELAGDLLRERRSQLIRAVQRGDSFGSGPFDIVGTPGCLQVGAMDKKLQVYIKTPFAPSERC
jgi:hypothetical protein